MDDFDIGIAGLNSSDLWCDNIPCQRDININDAITAFLTYLKACGRRPLTISSYGGSLGLLETAFGAATLKSINEFDMDRLVAGLADGQQAAVPRRAATMNRIVSTFRTFFDWACRRGLVNGNPVAGLKPARGSSTRTREFTRRETEAFMSAISASGERLALRDLALFGIYAYTGMRRSEALGLRTTDFDAGRAELRTNSTKGGVPATKHVPLPLAAILTLYTRAVNGCLGTGGPELLFPGARPDCHITARQVQTRFNHWKIRSRIRSDLTIHSFRAGFATELHQTTGDALLVSRALGHADVRTTARYVASDNLKMRRAIDSVFGMALAADSEQSPLNKTRVQL